MVKIFKLALENKKEKNKEAKKHHKKLVINKINKREKMKNMEKTS